ncbi:MAG: tRNA(Ile)-lysidine synthase [Verrucomicrobiales bacterium]|jgi:tRNA(Ile)-lysidine synthase
MPLSPLVHGLATLQQHYPRNRKYLIAVSGGRDSIALLHCLVSAGYRRLIICHLNHRLRGSASTADARFVASLGKRYDVPVETGTADVKRIANVEHLSIETAARLARHRFFFSVASQHRCRQIFLAHHADDQVESVLMHLFRGSGQKGTAGMPERTLMQPPPGSLARKPISIVRPFLDIWRSDIDTYIHTHKLKWREDASNSSTLPLRNRVRSVLVPELRQVFERDIRPMVLRFAEIAAEDHDFIASVASSELQEICSDTDQIRVSKLRALHPALQRECLKQWFQQFDLKGIGFREIEATRKLMDTTHPSKINLPHDRHVQRRAGWIFIA